MIKIPVNLSNNFHSEWWACFEQLILIETTWIFYETFSLNILVPVAFWWSHQPASLLYQVMIHYNPDMSISLWLKYYQYCTWTLFAIIPVCTIKCLYHTAGHGIPVYNIGKEREIWWSNFSINFYWAEHGRAVWTYKKHPNCTLLLVF